MRNFCVRARIKYIDQIDITEKRILIRVDFNVPLDENRKVADDTRIQRSLPTIKYALDNNAKIILMSHLDSPKGKFKPELTLLPAAEHLSKIIGQEVVMAPDCIGPEVEKLVSEMQPKDILLLENLRFHSEEEKGDKDFGSKLAGLADVYIDDAFGVAHRSHASNVTIVDFFQKFGGGFLMRDEIEYFRKVIGNPERPVIAIIGGAKVSGKLNFLENLIRKVDKIIIGGGMAFTFLKAQGCDVGESLVEDDLIETARRIIDEGRKEKKLYLPVDCVAADKFHPQAATKITPVQKIPSGWMGLDIGPATEKLFSEVLNDAKTIVWNGPMGVFEMDAFSAGTRAMVKMVAESPALTIVGGGDTDVAIHKWNATDKISYISTGGGAFIEILEGRPLPSIKALDQNSRKTNG
ncbi:MAG: phosphoglycerate kinase [Proteobacteria bacterium]|nr:phosphoglycerate kinase [Pseudomonadota bacterium]